MLAETRRRMLLDLISRQGFATLDELVKSLGVSESTVRRDLESLDLAGVVRRTHGGAVFQGELKALAALEDRAGKSATEKQAIGRAALGLIEEGDTVLLDGGTTTLEVARGIAEQDRALQVVTNSIPIAQLLASRPSIDLIMIGGYIYPRTGVALGPLALATMQGIKVRKAILGAGGIVAEGIYNANMLLVESERRMMSCAQETIIVADSTKFGRLALARLCGLDEVNRLVVDAGLRDEDHRMLEQAGLLVHIAEATNGTAAEGRPNGPLTPEGPRNDV